MQMAGAEQDVLDAEDRAASGGVREGSRSGLKRGEADAHRAAFVRNELLHPVAIGRGDRQHDAGSAPGQHQKVDCREWFVAAEAEDEPVIGALLDLLQDLFEEGLPTDPLDLAHGESPVPVDQAWSALETARSLSPTSPMVAFSSGFLALTQGDLITAERCGRALLRAGRGDEAVVAEGARLIAMIQDPRDVGEIVRVDLSDTSDFPGWMHHPRFLAVYDPGDYEAALGEAIAFGMPEFFWGPLERAASLAQLGLGSAAEREMRRAVALNPHLVRDPEPYLRVYILHPGTLEHVREGLEKAGLHRMRG